MSQNRRKEVVMEFLLSPRRPPSSVLPDFRRAAQTSAPQLNSPATTDPSAISSDA